MHLHRRCLDLADLHPWSISDHKACHSAYLPMDLREIVPAPPHPKTLLAPDAMASRDRAGSGSIGAADDQLRPCTVEGATPSSARNKGIRGSGQFGRREFAWAQRGHNPGICAQTPVCARIWPWVKADGPVDGPARPVPQPIHCGWSKVIDLARLAGFEPTTPAFGGQYSIQLSYRRTRDRAV